MKRRKFLSTTAIAGAAALPNPAAESKRAVIEIRHYLLRNSADQQMQRMTEILGNAWLPAAKRAGAGPVGAFASLVAPSGPFLMLVTSYHSLAAMEAVSEKMLADKPFRAGLDAWYAKPGLGYMRYESSLLRGFETVPQIEVPPARKDKSPRVFELRIYESNNGDTLRRKIKMFDSGEIGIFRRLGMLPVFFGETLVGRNQPNLTYMLAFDDLAHRERAWKAFVDDPEWAKMRVLPGLSDAEVVSNISNIMLRPMTFSEIR